MSSVEQDFNVYAYWLFGLRINSTIPLPELYPADDETSADVEIREGTVPQQLDSVTGKGVLYEINPHQMCMHVEDVASYFVEDGRRIVIEARDGANADAIRLFLLSSALGALLHQRSMLPLHGSCIDTPNGAVIIAGASGVGKSTTTAVFLNRGYKILTDDISVIQVDNNGAPVVVPAYPQLKLWEDSLENLEQTTAGLERVRPEFEKYRIPILDDFVTEPRPLRAIYILDASNNEQISINRVKGMQTIRLLMRHTYRATFLQQMGGVSQNMLLLAQNFPIHVVKRPREWYLLDDLVDALEEDFNA